MEEFHHNKDSQNLSNEHAVPAPGINWSSELTSEDEEIGIDEQAAASPRLIHPSELDLERIIQETKSENWETGAIDSVQPVQDVSPAPVPTMEDAFKDDDFRSAFGEGESLSEVFNNQESGHNQQNMPPVPNDTVSPTEFDSLQPDEVPDPMEKGRPKRKEGYGFWGLPHLAATAIWLLIILAIGVSIGRMVWLCASDVLALGRTPVSVTITIEEGDTITGIAQKLKDSNLINFTDLFVIYSNITDAHEKIQPGVYMINPPDSDSPPIIYDYMALVELMSPHRTGQTVVEDLRIPEGYTCAQIFQLLEDNNVCTVAELESYVAGINPEDSNAVSTLGDYWFLEGVQWGHKYSLEGYLFPNTYDFYENDEPQRVIEKMLNSFDANFNDVMKQKLQALEGYTIRDVIIIASMIEKETANQLESFTISSVIYNRLHKPNEYPFLNIDATIVYALGGKSDLTTEDLQVNSPYNTYTNKGLPPGPISSPSQNSIGAALDPEETDYYFYAFNPATGEHHFSKTYRDHLDFLNSLEG